MSETATLTLTDFLLARIAEDEEVARTAVGEWRSAEWHLDEYDETVLWYAPSSPEKIATVRELFGDGLAAEHARWSGQTIENSGPDIAPHIARWDPARVLAECEAKRRIMEAIVPMVERIEGYAVDGGVHYEPEDQRHPHLDLLRALALPYADHPDFDPAWRA